ncbi:hypothetical protein ACI2K4_23420 [Micromonospora sp. NPDC050397]|uniref:hypothetical protein n=1 Tax=Micromonospora sp. NPDC050397 TaxID=3364279 RepID=UPI00384EF05C
MASRASRLEIAEALVMGRENARKDAKKRGDTEAISGFKAVKGDDEYAAAHQDLVMSAFVGVEARDPRSIYVHRDDREAALPLLKYDAVKAQHLALAESAQVASSVATPAPKGKTSSHPVPNTSVAGKGLNSTQQDRATQR